MTSTHTILEYVWIDGNGEFRSKVKVIRHEAYKHKIIHGEDIVNKPEYFWSFDGSSTNQAVTEKSDLFCYCCSIKIKLSFQYKLFGKFNLIIRFPYS